MISTKAPFPSRQALPRRPRQPRQLPNRRRVLVEAEAGVDARGELGRAVAGEFLGLGEGHAGPDS